MPRFINASYFKIWSFFSWIRELKRGRNAGGLQEAAHCPVGKSRGVTFLTDMRQKYVRRQSGAFAEDDFHRISCLRVGKVAVIRKVSADDVRAPRRALLHRHVVIGLDDDDVRIGEVRSDMRGNPAKVGGNGHL